MAIPDPRCDEIIKKIQSEIPDFKIASKEDSLFMKIIFYGSLMFLWNPDFMTRYTSVIFGTVYTQKQYFGTDVLYRTLRHERIHLLDASNYPVIFELSYLFLLPSIFTMRAFWEYRAFKETLKVYSEDQGKIYNYQIEWILDKFTSSHYLWMFPFRNYLRNKILKFLVQENILLDVSK